MLGSTAAFRYISDTADKKATVKENKRQTDTEQGVLQAKATQFRTSYPKTPSQNEGPAPGQVQCGKDYLEIWRKEKYQWLLLTFLS